MIGISLPIFAIVATVGSVGAGIVVRRFGGDWPLLEGASCALVLAVLSLGYTGEPEIGFFIFSGMFIAICSIIAAIDLATQTVHDAWCLALATVGVAFHLFYGTPGLLLFVSVAGFLVLMAIATERIAPLSRFVGSGDLVFLAACFTWLGPLGGAKAIVIAIFAAPVCLLISHRRDMKVVAFCPMIAFGSIVAWFGIF